MQSAIFDTPVLKVESLKTKFDTIVLSNSFIALLGDCNEARILQQLHYWCYSEYGVIIDKIRWIYKPLREWLSEALTGITNWKLRVAIASLLEKGLIYREKLYVKHHSLKHDNPYWHPKNQTYYYSVNYDKLQELIDQAENRFEEAKKAETIENVRVVSPTKLSVEDFQDTKCCELSQNKTDITSTENISRDQSHPTLPCEWEGKKAKQGGLGGFPHEPLLQEEINQRKQEFSNPELLEIKEINSIDPKILEQDTNIGQVEENINQYKDTNNISTQPETEKLQTTDRPSPKLKAQSVTLSKQKREDKAPWQNEAEKSQFYRALIQALPIVANSHSPQGLAKTIMAQLKRGEEHTYWDDFKAGLPIGSSTKPEWEVEPGIPHPMFIEYLVEKLIAGNNSQTREQAIANALNIASSPKQAMFFWKECKISLSYALDEAERHRKLGVKALPTPLWTKERPEPTLTEAAIAGTKIQQINNSTQASIEAAKAPQIADGRATVGGFPRSGPVQDESKSEPSTPDPWQDEQPQPTMREMLAARGVKGFCKQMPKVSQAEIEKEERKQRKPKTNIATMAIAEINDYLKDPILRKQIMPQLWHSDYELITDEWGEIIGVESPPPAEE